jgi:hypothetical protein
MRDNKPIKHPHFEVLYHKERSDMLMIALTSYSEIVEEELRNALKRKSVNADLKDSVLTIEARFHVYSFDLADALKRIDQNNVFVTFAFKSKSLMYKYMKLRFIELDL